MSINLLLEGEKVIRCIFDLISTIQSEVSPHTVLRYKHTTQNRNRLCLLKTTDEDVLLRLKERYIRTLLKEQRLHMVVVSIKDEISLNVQQRWELQVNDWIKGECKACKTQPGDDIEAACQHLLKESQRTIKMMPMLGKRCFFEIIIYARTTSNFLPHWVLPYDRLILNPEYYELPLVKTGNLTVTPSVWCVQAKVSDTSENKK